MSMGLSDKSSVRAQQMYQRPLFTRTVRIRVAHHHCVERANIERRRVWPSGSGDTIGDQLVPTNTLNMFGSNLNRADNFQDTNASVRQTDSDAAIARLSAVKLGYLQDPFIRFLVQRPHLQPPRPPLINIGTYVRSEAIDRLVNEWLELSSVEGKKCQIVSMGAGSDTRFWRINVRGFFCVFFFSFGLAQ
jgi:hypothetical protein